MYQAVHVDKRNKVSYIRDDKEGWIVEEFKDYAFRKDSNGQFIGLFGDKFRKIQPQNYQKGDLEVHEQDISPVLRALTDKYLDEDSPPTQHRMVYFDIETQIGGTLNRANIKKALNKITSIAILDKTTNKKYVLILDEVQKLTKYEKDDKIVIPFKKETLLLKAFLDLWEEIDPTVIVGYNSSFFDVPYLYYRISKKLSIDSAKRLSPLGIVTEQDYSETTPIKLAGIASMDYLLLHKKFVPKVQPSYKLDYICKKEIGKGKLEFSGSLDKLFQEDIEKYIEYNLNDVTLLEELDNKLGFLDLAITICHFGHVEYESIYFSSVVLDGVIFTFLKRKGIVSPNKPQTNDPSLKKNYEVVKTKEEEEESSFKGAYVKDVQVGLHDWLTDLDLRQLYPTNIMSLNSGLETLIGRILVKDVDYNESFGLDYLNLRDCDRLGEYISIEKLDGTTKDVKLSALKKQIYQRNWSISGNGIIFDMTKKSILNEVLIEWTGKRDYYKTLMLKARDELDFDKAKFYDTYQSVYKTFCNSLYGVLILPSFRYCDGRKWLSSATTMTGQVIIKSTINYVNDKMNKELGTEDEDFIVASDTDSIFVKCSKIISHRLQEDILTIEDERIIPIVESFAHEMMKKLNTYYGELTKEAFNIDKHTYYIKPEYVIKRAYWSAKKKYACYLVRKEGTPIKKGSEFDYKGLDLMKSNFAPLFRDFSMNMINTLLLNGTKEVIDKMVVDFKHYILNCDYKELSLPTGLKQPLEKYVSYEAPSGQIFSKTTNGTPAHFKASIRYNDFIKFYKKNHEYSELKVGDPVAYCYLTTNPYKIDSIGFPANEEYPKEIEQIVEKYLDKNKNFDNQLLTKIQKFYDTLNWGVVNLNPKKTSNKWNRKLTLK